MHINSLKLNQNRSIPSHINNLSQVTFKNNDKEQLDANHSAKICASVPFRHYYSLSSIQALMCIRNFLNRNVIQQAIETNLKISQILKEAGINVAISDKNIDINLAQHLLTTCEYALQIAELDKLDWSSKSKLAFASLLHDIGKALIPEEIVQKPGIYTDYDRKIIDLHSQLGYEILRTQESIDDDILEAVLLHHASAEEKNDNKIAQILSVADVYSALKEERPYRGILSDGEAFKIMDNSPNLSKKYVSMLKLLRGYSDSL